MEGFGLTCGQFVYKSISAKTENFIKIAPRAIYLYGLLALDF